MPRVAPRRILSRLLPMLVILGMPGASTVTDVHAQPAPPNIILIVTDDQDARLLEQMPNVQQ